MKATIIFVIIFSFVVSETLAMGGFITHTFGVPSMEERLIHREVVEQSFRSIGRIVKHLKYTVPLKNGKGPVITRVVVIDLKNGGNVSIKEGGPGTQFVVISLQSKLLYGIKYAIEIYGIDMAA